MAMRRRRERTERPERSGKGSENPRRKAKDLIRLALDRNSPENERSNAAVQAIRLIAEYDLLSSPLDEMIEGNETTKAIKNVVDTLKDPELIGNLKTIGAKLGQFRKR
jgi:hypothetical protein